LGLGAVSIRRDGTRRDDGREREKRDADKEKGHE
jgi:hypothetical protein